MTAAEKPGQIFGAQDVTHRYALERTRLTLDAGLLGQLFGSAANAPTNIAGVVACLFTISSIAVLFMPSKIDAIEYLQRALPVITLVLGYLVGKKVS